MILSFKTKINGKPTYFVEKIHSGLLQNDLLDMVGFDDDDFDGFDINKVAECEPKIHTIRKDDKNRWKPGMMIDFFINARQKDMFRFAPRIQVVSTQKIKIDWYSRNRFLDASKLSPNRFNYVDVIVDNTLLTIQQTEKLAINDGFDDVESFFDYFNEDFEGKILHWTDFKY